MVEVPLSWRLQITGAEQVKARLQEINQQFRNGEIDATSYAKGIREINRDARSFVNIGNVSKNVFLAQHPALNNLSRAMSTFSSVSHTALTIANSLNIMLLKQTTQSAASLETRRLINEETRKLNRLEAEGLKGTEEYRASREKLNILLVQETELLKQNNLSWIDTVTILSSVSFAIGSLTPVVIKLIPHMKALGGAMAAIGLGSSLSLLSLVPYVGLFVALASAAYYLSDIFLSDLIPSWEEMDYWWYSRGSPMLANMVDWFTVQLPVAFLATLTFMQDFFLPGFMTIWNGIISITAKAVNLLIEGLEVLINSFIRVINQMISAYNRVARKIRLPTLSLIPTVQLPRLELPALTADVMPNFENNALQLGTGIPLTLSGGTSGGGSSQQIIINVAGSVITERELFARMDAYLKEKLKDRGF